MFFQQKESKITIYGFNSSTTDCIKLKVEKRTMILKNIRFLVTQNDDREVSEYVDLEISEGKISRIGEDISGSETVDCSDKIVLPGLINCHTHVAMTILRGISDNEVLDNWLFENIVPAEGKMDAEHVRAGAEAGIIEMLKSGTTCFNDMYFHEEQVTDVVEELGIRARLGYGIVDQGQDTDSEISASREFIEYVSDKELVSPAVNPHSVYTCSATAIEKSIGQSKEFDIPVHIHVSETESENEDFIEETGQTPFEYLENKGLLDRKTIAAHCTNLSDNDIEIMKKNDVGAVHCPSANLKLGSGIAPIPELLEQGITVGLGTDGPASNNSLNMFQEMKTAALIQKNSDPREMSAQTVLDMATVNGAKILGLEKIGRTKEGWKADLITVEIDEAMRPVREENIVSHLLFSNPKVSETIVGGSLLVEDGELVEEVEIRDFEELSKQLW